MSSRSSLRNACLVAGLVAGAACLAGGWFAPRQALAAYLVAVLFWLGISLGSLGISLIHHLTGGGWGRPIRRILESATGTLPLLAILFLPIALGLPHLYSWARPETVASDPILQAKAWYLNPRDFQVRAAVYFVLWILMAFMVGSVSGGADPRREPERRAVLSRLAGPGLIAWGLTVTFASIDWAMSLEPHWYSSMYGAIFMASQAVSGMSFALVVAIVLRDRPPWRESLTTPRLHDLGNFLLAFVMFWTYVSFSQYLIIWSANLPEETPWYLHRSRGGWQYVAQALIGLHFVVPFLLLLSRGTKRQPKRLVQVAGLLLGMRLVDLTWLVMPSFSPGRLALSWMNVAAPIAVGGLWLAVFAWRLEARAAIPVFELEEMEEAGHAAAGHAH